MTDTLIVSGTIDEIVGGYVVFEDLPYVLTVSESYLVDGWPIWSYRYTNPLDPEFTQSLGDMVGGSTSMYDGNPVAFLVPSGKFDLGSQGVIRSLITDYLGGFDDFAVFPAAGQDPTLDGWVHPSSPLSVNAPLGDITTAWAEASMMVFPPKAARFVVPTVSVANLPAGNSVYLDAFDMRVTPSVEDPTIKPAYAPPRNLSVKVKPTRLNYAKGTTTVTDLDVGETYTASALVNDVRQSYSFVADESTVEVFPSPNLVPQAASYMDDTTQYSGWISNAAGQVVVNSSTPLFGTRSLDVIPSMENWGYYPMDGAIHGSTNPNPLRNIGTTYTAQILVRSTTDQDMMLTDYGTSQTKGPTVHAKAGVPTLLTVTFVAGSNVYLSVRDPARARTLDKFTMDNFQVEVGTAASTFVYSLDEILVEAGTTVGDYFDGYSGGSDYMWEQGGTPGLCRSYYYQDREARNYILIRLLQENVPLGMTVSEPIYAVFDGTIGGTNYGAGPYGVGAYGWSS